MVQSTPVHLPLQLSVNVSYSSSAITVVDVVCGWICALLLSSVDSLPFVLASLFCAHALLGWYGASVHLWQAHVKCCVEVYVEDANVS